VIEIPDDGSPVPEEIEVERWRYPLAEYHAVVKFRRKNNQVIEAIYVDEWNGLLWPFWFVLEMIDSTARWLWRQILRLTACKIRGHDVKTVNDEYFEVKVCSRCKNELEFTWKKGGEQ